MNGYIFETEDNYSYLAEMAFEQYAAYLYLEQSDRKKIWKYSKWIEYTILIG
jgi:hypothetical protein